VGSSPSPACTYAPFAAVDAQRVTVSPDGLDLYAPGSGRMFSFALRATPPAPSGTPPAVALEDPAYVGQFRVQLRGRIVPGATAWTDRFEYGTTTAYGASTPRASDSRDGDAVDLDAAVLGLAPGTTYHYRLMAMTAAGVTYSPDATFTTLPYTPQSAPDVETMGALGNAGTGAALAATVDPGGDPTTYRFQWGDTSALGRETPARALPGDSRYHSVTAVIGGLTPGTDYYFRVVATNSVGSADGLLSRFTAATPATPVTPAPSATVSPGPLTVATPTPSPPAVLPSLPAAVTPRPVHRRAPLTAVRLRRAGRGLVVTYRDTRTRVVVLTVSRGSRVVLRMRHRGHPGRNRIHRRHLRPGAYVIRLRSASGAALTGRLHLHIPR
jgi:hypothetical protein